MQRKINFILALAAVLILVIFTDCGKQPITSITTFDGNTISFNIQGKGEPSIILVHGWSNNRSIWDEQMLHFSKKYQVIAIDLPGFGQSGNNRTKWSMESYGKDIAEIVQQMRLDKVVLVGFSLGGAIVIEGATRLPEQVKGVVLVDNLQQIEIQIPPQLKDSIIQAESNMMMNLIQKPDKENLVAGGFFKHNIDESFDKVCSMVDVDSYKGWSESIQEYMHWLFKPSTDVIQKVEAPIIAINSDMRATNVDSWKKYQPGFKAKIVKDAGHVIMWDKPEEFNLLLEETIQEFTRN